MPITFRLDSELRLVEAQYTGNITMDDVRDFPSQVVKHPSFGPEFRLLCVFAGIKTRVSSDDVRQYQGWRKQFPRFRKIAIVATTDFEYGIGRMFELASGAAGATEMQVFRKMPDARKWLGLLD